jgi:drug/metabolite transporter (DMT)-like permease
MVLWAAAFVVIRGLRDVLDPGPMALARLLVGSVVLTAVALGRPGGPRRLPRGRALILIIGYGVLWFGVYSIAVNAAGRYLDAGTSAMLVNLAPIIVAVLAGTFLHEGFPRNLVLGLVIAFAGVVIIAGATATGQIRPAGVVLALAAAVLYAVGVLLQKQALASVDSVTVTWLGALAGTVATLPFLPGLVIQARANPWPVVPGVIFLGVFPTAIALPGARDRGAPVLDLPGRGAGAAVPDRRCGLPPGCGDHPAGAAPAFGPDRNRGWRMIMVDDATPAPPPGENPSHDRPDFRHSR